LAKPFFVAIIAFVIIIYFSFYKIFDYLKKNYPEKFKEMGEPKWYRMKYNYKVFFGLMFGRFNLPGDFEITFFVWLLRIIYIVVIYMVLSLFLSIPRLDVFF